MIFLLPLEGDNVIIVWILTTFNRFHKLVRILLYPVDTSDRLCAVSAAKNRPGNPVKPWWFPNLENRKKSRFWKLCCRVRQVYHSGLKILEKSHFNAKIQMRHFGVTFNHCEHCLKIIKNVVFEFFNLGIFQRFLSY